MNSLVVPPSPNWYEVKIMACAPDGTLVYGSRNDLVCIKNKPENGGVDIRLIEHSHTKKVNSVDINKQWGSPNKWVLSAGDDKLIKVWDIETYEKLFTQNALERESRVVGAAFLNENRILGVAESGLILLWVLSTNEVVTIRDLLGPKTTVTCFEPCPHASYMTAFGLKNGLVVIADLRKNGRVLFKLRGHDKEVVSLSWCPVPINVFPSNPNNYLKGTVPKMSEIEASDVLKDKNEEAMVVYEKTEVKDISTESAHADKVPETPEIKEVAPVESEVINEEEKKTYASTEIPIEKSEPKPKKKVKINPWINLKHADDDEIAAESKQDSPKDSPECGSPKSGDFLSDCKHLLGKILGRSKSHDEDETHEPKDPEAKKQRKILKGERKTSKKTEDVHDTVEESPESPSEVETIHEKTDESEKSSEREKETTEESEIKKSADGQKPAEQTRIIAPNSMEEEPRDEYLLASSARDSTIYIWRAGSDGRLQNFIQIPDNKQQARRNYHHKDTVFNVVLWVAPTILLSSTKRAELLQWTLPKPKGFSKQFTKVHQHHSLVLFSIAAPLTVLTKDNWMEYEPRIVWTCGQDRNLIRCDLQQDKNMFLQFATLLGEVQCFAQSFVDPNLMALGLTGPVVKLWNLSEPHVNTITMRNIKLQSKISCLDWHPTLEGILAFATVEGRVGIIEASQKEKINQFKQFFSSEVFKLQWGPLGGHKDTLGLYSLADGKLIMYKNKHFKNDPQIFDLPDKTFVYSFTWKPNYEILILCDVNGTLIVYNKDLKIVATYHLKKKVANLTWHPEALSFDVEECPRAFWLAASSDKNVYVYNLHKFDSNDENKNEDLILAHYQSIALVTSVSWSSFEPNKLVFGSDDGLAQVWDVENKIILATYYEKNLNPVISVAWSPLRHDFILTGTVSNTLVVWNISDYPPADSEFYDDRKKLVSQIKYDFKKESTARVNKSTEEPSDVKKTKSKSVILPHFAEATKAADKANILKKLIEWKENKCLVDESGDSVQKSDLGSLQIFGNQTDILEMLLANEKANREKGKFTNITKASLFKGDFSKHIKEAIESRRVTPIVISMAPLVSLTVWQEACETYASQLAEEINSDPLEIALYYLMCHKIEPAVNVLCENGLFKEALALVKCRLPEENPLVNEVLEKWANNAQFTGNYEQAAQCYIVLGDYEKAVKVLFRREDPKILDVALILAEKTENKDLIDAVAFRCKSFSEPVCSEISSETASEIPKKGDAILQKCAEEIANLELTDNRDENKVPEDLVSENNVVEIEPNLENLKITDDVPDKKILEVVEEIGNKNEDTHL